MKKYSYLEKLIDFISFVFAIDKNESINLLADGTLREKLVQYNFRNTKVDSSKLK